MSIKKSTRLLLNDFLYLGLQGSLGIISEIFFILQMKNGDKIPV